MGLSTITFITINNGQSWSGRIVHKSVNQITSNKFTNPTKIEQSLYFSNYFWHYTWNGWLFFTLLLIGSRISLFFGSGWLNRSRFVGRVELVV